MPGAPIYTNPYTGRYAISLPQSANYTLHVTPVATGYQPVDRTVTVGTSNKTQDISVPVDADTCTAPGYAYTYQGMPVQTFDGTATPEGWAVVDNAGSGQIWSHVSFTAGVLNRSWGSGGYEKLDETGDQPVAGDTSLVSPAIDLSAVASPAVGFDMGYQATYASSVVDVDLSVNGGQDWTTVWEKTTHETVQGPFEIGIPQAASKPNVRVRVRFAFSAGIWGWIAVDNVFVGARTCAPTPGGLIAGLVSDANTSMPLNAAGVVSINAPADETVTAATPDDPSLTGGFYELFSSVTGEQKFTATENRYQLSTKAVTVAPDGVTKANFSLQAGHLTVASSLSGTAQLGKSTTQNLTITNTGKVDAHVTVSEQSGGFTSLTQPAGGGGAALKLLKGHFSQFPGLTKATTVDPSTTQAQPTAGTTNTPWVEIPSYSQFISRNVAGYDANSGKVYSAGGWYSLSSINSAAVYDPTTQAWTDIASMPVGVAGASAEFLNGKLYVVGGFNGLPEPGYITVEHLVQIYDPASDTWSAGAQIPGPPLFAASATLNGQIYVVGGCSDASAIVGPALCYQSASDNASRYDPITNSWSTIASYPIPVSSLACGGMAGELVCTGGINTTTSSTSKSTYVYSPATNTWSKAADLPIDLWGMGYGAANGQLLVSDGVTGNSTEITNQGFAYQPASNAWASLPNSNDARYMGGSACGFFQIGGAESQVIAGSEELPGYSQCSGDGTKVSWLSATPTQIVVPAGGNATVAVALDASVTGVNQPGAYTARLTLSTDTPYTSPTIGVTLNVTPPKTWGKITGTVAGAACSGTTSPLAGATVQVDSWAGTYTLTTDASGRYVLWLDKRNNPLTLIVARNGWRPQTRTVKVKTGRTTTADFTLKPQQACS